MLKTAASNQETVMEKKRAYSKTLQLFRQQCETNKELMRRLRELQQRRSGIQCGCLFRRVIIV